MKLFDSIKKLFKAETSGEWSTLYALKAESLIPKAGKGKFSGLRFYSSDLNSLKEIEDTVANIVANDKDSGYNYLFGELPIFDFGKFVFSIPFKNIHFGDVHKILSTQRDPKESLVSKRGELFTNSVANSIFADETNTHLTQDSVVVRLTPDNSRTSFVLIGGISNNIEQGTTDDSNLISREIGRKVFEQLVQDVVNGKFAGKTGLLSWNPVPSSTRPIDDALENKKTANSLQLLLDGYPIITGMLYN